MAELIHRGRQKKWQNGSKNEPEQSGELPLKDRHTRVLQWNIVNSDVQRPRNGLQFAGLLSPAPTKIRIKYCKKCYYILPWRTYFVGQAYSMPYLLYSDTSLIRSSVEILLLSCLKRGEKRDSLSSAPWLSLNTDL